MGGVLQAATGAGKTRMAAKLVQLLQVQTLFVVNTKALLEQAKGDFEKLLGVEVGVIGGGKVDVRSCTITTVQSLARAFGFAKKGDFDEDDEWTDEEMLARKVEIIGALATAKCVIVDECHGVAARTCYSVVLEATSAVCVVGLSASPWRDDGADILIEAACGPVTYKISATDLIDRGWLVRPTIEVHQLPNPTDGNPDRRSDTFGRVYNAWVVDDEARNSYICDLVEVHLLAEEQVIILVKQVRHGRALEKMLKHRLGDGCVKFLHGQVATKQRKETMATARQGDLRCLIGTSLADQGLDLPRASVLVLAGGGKSSTRALQRIGRVLRTEDGRQVCAEHAKKTATVYDIVDFGQSTLRRHYYERLRIYKSEPGFNIQVRKVQL
jgi:superfamily II DNA or RNA helicase